MPPSLPGMDIEGVDELFALPPAEFTAARNALVKQLRADKRRNDAEAVKALRRPSVPAWAVNSAARKDPDAIDRLIEAGAAVGAAQRRALSGVREAGLREASAARRERIDEVWKVAAAILREAGIEPQAHRSAIAATLEAASVESEAADAVRKGRLTADLPAPSGFGAVSGFSLVPASNEPDTDEPAEGKEGAAGADAAAEEETQDSAAARKARQRAEEGLADALSQRNRLARRAEELAERATEQRRQAVRSAAEADRLEQRAAQARSAAERDALEADDLAEDAERAQRTAAEADAEFQRLRMALEES